MRRILRVHGLVGSSHMGGWVQLNYMGRAGPCLKKKKKKFFFKNYFKKAVIFRKYFTTF
jgi:hypothetical protein